MVANDAAAVGIVLLPIRRRGRSRPIWRDHERHGARAAAPPPPHLIWINHSPATDPIDLELVSSSEADGRTRIGRLPVGVILDGSLLRRELASSTPAEWLLRSRRVVACEAVMDMALEVPPLGEVQLRRLARPFGARHFSAALTWASGRSSRWEAGPG